MREIELKLEFDPADLARIRAHPLLAATDSQRKTLRSIYYDTADFVLRKAGVSLRVRDSNGQFVQTIKRANDNAGLFDRSEWEHEVKDRDIDLIAASGTALEPLLSVRVRDALRPVFETRVKRTVYQLVRDGSDIEIALDRGEVDAGGRKAPIHELELELKRGEAAELFRLARELDATVPLRIAGKVKAERGYELVEDAHQAFEKAKPISLTQVWRVERPFVPSCIIVSVKLSPMSQGCAPATPKHCIRCGSVYAACVPPSLASPKSPPIPSRLGSKQS